MLIDAYDWGLETRQIQLLLGLVLGAVFGIAAQISRFCLRRAIGGPSEERRPAAAVWLTGLLSAIIGVAGANAFGLIEISDHRLQSASLPLAAIIAGGVMFGIGMIQTRGCVSRLTVLSASGNLRAATVLVVFAITAHATLKGVLAPVRTSIGTYTVESPVGSLSELGLGIAILAAIILIALLTFTKGSGVRRRDLGLGATIGLIAAFGWAATSVLFFDEFDPLPVQSAAFTLPWSDTLFWTIASSAIPASFGVGLIGGVLFGSFVSAALRGELRAESFSSPSETLRYLSGGMLMGIGGVLAGGCTVGAGISGVATGSIAAIIALIAIIAGGFLADRLQNSTYFGKVPSVA